MLRRMHLGKSGYKVVFCMILAMTALMAYQNQIINVAKHEFNCDGFNISQAQKFQQNDPCLIRYIYTNAIYPRPNRAFNLTQSDMERHYAQVGQDRAVDELLHRKRNGFFIECGAGDGESLSNTLFLERARNWTGLLIEADPYNFNALQSKKRAAYLVNNCLSINDQSSKMLFQRDNGKEKYSGGLLAGFDASHGTYMNLNHSMEKLVEVQCYPFYSLLLAANRTHVDYFSLDVEGPEIEILKTIPWDMITIDVLTVEFRVIKGQQWFDFDWEETAKKFKRLNKYMLQNNHYELVYTLPKHEPQERGLDAVYKRTS